MRKTYKGFRKQQKGSNRRKTQKNKDTPPVGGAPAPAASDAVKHAIYQLLIYLERKKYEKQIEELQAKLNNPDYLKFLNRLNLGEKFKNFLFSLFTRKGPREFSIDTTIYPSLINPDNNDLRNLLIDMREINHSMYDDIQDIDEMLAKLKLDSLSKDDPLMTIPKKSIYKTSKNIVLNSKTT
jgi:hypothetical protein